MTVTLETLLHILEKVYETVQSISDTFQRRLDTGPIKPIQPMKIIDIPKETSWSDLTFSFPEKSVLHVYIRGQAKPLRLEPDDLGMRNLKNGQPVMAWHLLHILVETKGMIAAESSKGFHALKQQKYLLSKTLRSFFGIEEDPLIWGSGEHCWEAQFFSRTS
ncbi:hypothetical protein ACQZV8_19810 [Magnetococcales bacterium HHB-1]